MNKKQLVILTLMSSVAVPNKALAGRGFYKQALQTKLGTPLSDQQVATIVQTPQLQEELGVVSNRFDVKISEFVDETTKNPNDSLEMRAFASGPAQQILRTAGKLCDDKVLDAAKQTYRVYQTHKKTPDADEILAAQYVLQDLKESPSYERIDACARLTKTMPLLTKPARDQLDAAEAILGRGEVLDFSTMTLEGYSLSSSNSDMVAAAKLFEKLSVLTPQKEVIERLEAFIKAGHNTPSEEEAKAIVHFVSTLGQKTPNNDDIIAAAAAIKGGIHAPTLDHIAAADYLISTLREANPTKEQIEAADYLIQKTALKTPTLDQVAAAEDLVTQGVATPSVGQIAVHVHQAAGLDYKDAGQVAAAEDLVTQGVATPSVGQIAVHVHQAAGLDYKDAGQVAAADHLIRTLGQANPTQAQIEAEDYLYKGGVGTTLDDVNAAVEAIKVGIPAPTAAHVDSAKDWIAGNGLTQDANPSLAKIIAYAALKVDPTVEQIAAAEHMATLSQLSPTKEQIEAADYLIQNGMNKTLDDINAAAAAIKVGIAAPTLDHIASADAWIQGAHSLTQDTTPSLEKIIAYAALKVDPTVEQIAAAEHMATLSQLSPTKEQIEAAVAFRAGGVGNPSVTEISHYNGITGKGMQKKRGRYVQKIAGGQRDAIP